LFPVYPPIFPPLPTPALQIQTTTAAGANIATPVSYLPKSKVQYYNLEIFGHNDFHLETKMRCSKSSECFGVIALKDIEKQPLQILYKQNENKESRTL
jgi:hypothetical protein